LFSLRNVIGFLIEAYERGMVDRKFLDGIDLKWGSVDAAWAMIEKIAARDGVGTLAAKGVRALSRHIGKGSEKFAIQVKLNWGTKFDEPLTECYRNRGWDPSLAILN